MRDEKMDCFASLAMTRLVATPTAQINKSLFGSFSSEKELLFL
jgi:hypothetical protein